VLTRFDQLNSDQIENGVKSAFFSDGPQILLGAIGAFVLILAVLTTSTFLFYALPIRLKGKLESEK